MSLCVVFRESPNHFGNDLLNLSGEILINKFGGHKAVVRPVPIPNTAVKHSLADGSGCIASARVGCRQIFQKKPKTPVFGFLFAGARNSFRLASQAAKTVSGFCGSSTISDSSSCSFP